MGLSASRCLSENLDMFIELFSNLKRPAILLFSRFPTQIQSMLARIVFGLMREAVDFLDMSRLRGDIYYKTIVRDENHNVSDTNSNGLEVRSCHSLTLTAAALIHFQVNQWQRTLRLQNMGQLCRSGVKPVW